MQFYHVIYDGVLCIFHQQCMGNNSVHPTKLVVHIEMVKAENIFRSSAIFIWIEVKDKHAHDLDIQRLIITNNRIINLIEFTQIAEGLVLPVDQGQNI